jgi:hypothetical protein
VTPGADQVRPVRERWNLLYRLAAKYPFGDLEVHGMPFFHREHYHGTRSSNPLGKENPRKMNPMEIRSGFAPNPPSWGLHDESLLGVPAGPPDVLQEPEVPWTRPNTP